MHKVNLITKRLTVHIQMSGIRIVSEMLFDQKMDYFAYVF